MPTITPFWQYRQASLFKHDKIKKSDIEQCVKDWTRGEEENITVNGVRFDKLLASRGLSAETLTGDQLREVWRETLLATLPKAEQDKMLAFMEQVFHQGGVPCALRSRLTDVASARGHMVGASGVNGTMSFTVVDNKLIIKEDMHLDKMLLNSNSKHGVKQLVAEKGEHLLSGTAVYSMDLSAKEPAVECVDLVLNHHNDTTTKIFDTRGILAKVVDFLKSLTGMNKLVDPTETQTQKPSM
ncbi:hypothetical protein [Legionella feeleii]|uniref:Uncharacterized protein n=1 Tax=Legionella feeleii TaxID=453 RepID=A0A378IXD8_9GAMM|nr:hypothetical protein [Legionella feeleii]STX39896.1 Uncharacterised protein [Legionella feeleii]